MCYLYNTWSKLVTLNVIGRRNSTRPQQGISAPIGETTCVTAFCHCSQTEERYRTVTLLRCVGVPRALSIHFFSVASYKRRMTISLVHKIRLHGRRGKGTAESFSRGKSRQAPQKEGGEILCDPGWYVHKPVVQNKWDDNTHTHTHTGTLLF